MMADRKSRSWSLRHVGTASFGMPSAWQNLRKWRKLIKPGPTVEGAVFQLTNLGTGEDRYFFFAGAGLAAGFGRASANIEADAVQFETVRPYRFRDFEGIARLGNFSVGLGINASVSFVVFNGIDVDQAWYKGDEIPLNLFSAGTGVDLSYCVGLVAQVTDPTDIAAIAPEQEVLPPDEGAFSDPGENADAQQCVDSPFGLGQCLMPVDSPSNPESSPLAGEPSPSVGFQATSPWPAEQVPEASPNPGVGWDTDPAPTDPAQGLQHGLGQPLSPEGMHGPDAGEIAPNVGSPDPLPDPAQGGFPVFHVSPDGGHMGGG